MVVNDSLIYFPRIGMSSSFLLKGQQIKSGLVFVFASE